MLRVSKTYVNLLIACFTENHFTIFASERSLFVASIALDGFLKLKLLEYLKQGFILIA